MFSFKENDALASVKRHFSAFIPTLCVYWLVLCCITYGMLLRNKMKYRYLCDIKIISIYTSMETKEMTYKGMLMNGFLALFINLLVIPALGLLAIYYSNSLAMLLPALIVLGLAFFIMLAGYFS